MGLVLIRLYGLFEPPEALALAAVVLALLLYAVATPLTLPVAEGAMLLAGLWGMLPLSRGVALKRWSARLGEDRQCS
ncbi:MAG: hypothetical protein DRO39_09745 [Thermoprotei archaeon]|nr:MAG: hypothetical protein DRO39_09745 [Thermoprotei archaeon]